MMFWEIVAVPACLVTISVASEPTNFVRLVPIEAHPAPTYRWDWDTWANNREVRVNCDKYNFGSETEVESYVSEKLCRDYCEEHCSNVATLTALATCLGRASLLQCEFAYSRLEYIPMDNRWCLDYRQAAHIYLTNMSEVSEVRSREARQMRWYLDANVSLDDECLNDIGGILELYGPNAKIAAYEDDIQCPTETYSVSLYPSVATQPIRVDSKILSGKLTFPVHEAMLGLLVTGANWRAELLLAPCITALQNPTNFSSNSWMGFVLEVEQDPISVRSLYNPKTNGNSWYYKGPYAQK
eukprot:Blabericola_migrator_1__4911@NODE_2562_length_2604_cov_51_361451_g1601_i0_p2_GENE_NODE_2562_length_2604_cov_51_361451_g1601_i0NODE_2562_length_2604_cov_51_361451_g1601_i0_p2_ORF_typecomplete_len298_score23_27FlgD_ig/PF13860_6/0_057_NODE_2562_length_2604_cov_51_361451_g1601_i013682261